MLLTADRPGTFSADPGNAAYERTASYPDLGMAVVALKAASVPATAGLSADRVDALTVTFTPADGSAAVAKAITNTVSPIAAATATSTTQQADFTGASGTLLTSKPGWAISNGSGAVGVSPSLDGNGALTATANSYEASATLMTTVGATLPNSVFTFELGNGSANTRSLQLIMAAESWNNCIVVGVLQRGGPGEQIYPSAIRRLQGGAPTDVANFSGNVAHRQNGTATVTGKVSADGKTLVVTITGARTDGQPGDAVSTATVSLDGLTLGTRMGLGQREAGCKILAAQYLNVQAALTYKSVSTFTNSATAIATFEWSGLPPTQLQYHLEDDASGAVTDWLVADTVVTGTTSGTATATFTAPSKGVYRARFRYHNDTGIAAIADHPTAFLANAFYKRGGNIMSATYFVPHRMLNDWGRNIAIRGDGDVLVLAAAITGTWDVETNTGVELRSNHATIIVDDTSPSTGKHKIRVTGDLPIGSNVRGLKWLGTKPQYFTVSQPGLTSKIAAEWTAGMEGRWLRDLDMGGANGVPLSGKLARPLATDRYYGEDTPFVPYQDLCDAMVAWRQAKPTEAEGWWHVIGPDETDADLTAKFTYIRDNLLSVFLDFKLALELGNERPWGYVFDGTKRLILDGIRKGHWGDATWNAPKPEHAVDVWGEGNAGATYSGTAATGDWIVWNTSGQGPAVFEAKRPVAAGSVVVDGPDWTKRTDIDTFGAGRKWAAVRFSQIIALAKSIFGPAYSRVIPILSGQAGGPGGLLPTIATELSYVPGHAADIRGGGYGWYFSHEEGFDYSTATAAKIEASFRANFENLRKLNRAAFLDAQRRGWIYMPYEGGTHPTYLRWRDGANAASPTYAENRPYRQGWDELFSSAAGRALIRDIMRAMLEDAPGTLMEFQIVGEAPWGMKTRLDDNANPRRLGVLDAIAA